MRIEIIENRNRSGNYLGFVRGDTKKYGRISVPAYFAKESKDVAPGEQEVMISGVLFHKNDEGFYDYKKAPKCFFIRTLDGVMKAHLEGFECIGTMCETTSSATLLDGSRKQIHTVTPGLLMEYIYVAENVNATFDKREPYPLKPLIGWIKKHPSNGHHRLEGVEDLKDLNI